MFLPSARSGFLWATAGSQIFRWRGQGIGWMELEHGIANAPEFNAVWALALDDYAVGGGVVAVDLLEATRAIERGIFGTTSRPAPQG